jgi:DNA-binding SARP family transcriptional activator
VVRVSRTAQRLVAFLGLQSAARARAFVAGHLWMDASDERAAAALRTVLWRLGARASHFVRCEDTLLDLAPEVVVDLKAVSAIARACLDTSAPLISATQFAVLRDSGDVLPDWYDDWVIIQRECFRQLRLHALETLCLRFSAAGRYADATDAGLAAIRSDPLRESAHRAMVTAHLAAGNSSDGLRQYRLCCTLLGRDLERPPSDEFQRLVAHMFPSKRHDLVPSPE